MHVRTAQMKDEIDGLNLDLGRQFVRCRKLGLSWDQIRQALLDGDADMPIAEIKKLTWEAQRKGKR